MTIFLDKSKAYREKSDEELLFFYKKKKDTEIIGVFYERYHHLVFGVCLKYFKNTNEANEALFDIYSSLYESLKKYDVKDFKKWILTVARNHCLSELKRKSKETEFNPYSKNSPKYFMESDEEISLKIATEQKIDALQLALKKLKSEQKQCIELFFLEDKTYAEIVEITAFELKKVKSYIQNGKRNLQNLLNNEF